MVFASLSFLYIFLPLNLILYYVSRNSAYRNFLLIVFSLVFYAWGEPVWIGLLFCSAIIDWLNALFIDRFRGTKWAKVGVISSVLFNVGTLVLFKYSAFLYENINHAFNLSLQAPHFALPVGISFKVFQTLSYVIDVYRGQIRTQKSFTKYLMFVSLYHHLVAGPIVRYAHIAHEIDHRRFNIGDISSGVSRFCIGLFKKVCIANVAAGFVDKYMGGPIDHLSVGESWFGVIMFTVQIYFDFSGYSDMAIGLGKMFGFHYHENFRHPYIATSATEFWRRWHISLGTFFRDYIYIPLGGNRRGTPGTWIIFGIFATLATALSVYSGLRYANWFPAKAELITLAVLMLPMLFTKEKKIAFAGSINLFFIWFLTGMWHGASWNFMLWGLYFGLLIFLERLFLARILQKLPKLIGHLYLLSAAVLGWALFYFTDFEKLKSYLRILFGQSGHERWSFALTAELRENMYWLILAFVLCMPVYIFIVRKVRRMLVRMEQTSPRTIRVGPYRTGVLLLSMGLSFVLLFLATAMLVGKSYNPFIYYRF